MADDGDRCPHCSCPDAFRRLAPMPSLTPIDDPEDDGSAAVKRARLGPYSKEYRILRQCSSKQRHASEALAKHALLYSAEVVVAVSAFDAEVEASLLELRRRAADVRLAFLAAARVQEKALDGDIDSRKHSALVFECAMTSGDEKFIDHMCKVGVEPLYCPIVADLPSVKTMLILDPALALAAFQHGSDEHLTRLVNSVSSAIGMMAIFNLIGISDMPLQQPRPLSEGNVIQCFTFLSSLRDAEAYSTTDFHAYSLAFMILYASDTLTARGDLASCSPVDSFLLHRGSHCSIALNSPYRPRLEELVLAYCQRVLFLPVEDEEADEDEEEEDDPAVADINFTRFECLLRIVLASGVEHTVEVYGPAISTMERVFNNYVLDEYFFYTQDMCAGLLDVYLSPAGQIWISTCADRAEAALECLAHMAHITTIAAHYTVSLKLSLGTKLFEVYHLLSLSAAMRTRLRPDQASVYAAVLVPDILLQHYLNLTMERLAGSNAHLVALRLLDVLLLTTTDAETKTPADIRQMVGRYFDEDDWVDTATDL